MSYTLWISKRDFESLYTHAEVSLPYESVALLFGKKSQSEIHITVVEAVRNESQSRTEFLVNPETQYQLLLEADERGDELVSIFHSHPAPPVPSLKDIKNMHLNPVVWIIASKQTGIWNSKAYVLVEDVIEDVVVRIID